MKMSLGSAENDFPKMTPLAEALGKGGSAGQNSLQFLHYTRTAPGHTLLPGRCGGGGGG